MRQTTSVSVIVPTHDRPTMLRAALESIRALEGDDLTIEICIGDNGDNPENEKLANEFACKYAKTSANGAAAARNIALKLATGEFIGFLDDDDVLLEDALRAQIRHFEHHPDCHAVFGQVVFADHRLKRRDEQWPVAPPPDGDMVKHMLSGFFPQLGATVVRRTVLSDIGYLDEALTGDEDWDWQIRIARDFETAIIDTDCVLFRGRAPGKHDDLLALRVRFTRKVFARHAFAERKRWSGPVDFARSYFSSQEHYYYYFLEAADYHRSKGRFGKTTRALWQALTTFPTRFVRSLLFDRSFRRTYFGN